MSIGGSHRTGPQVDGSEKNTCKTAGAVLYYPGIKSKRAPARFGALKEVNSMKEGIHPKYEQTTIRCACGNVIETGSTKKDIRVEICSKCHPFYTGKQKLVDTGGRVDRFKRKYGIK